jgi:hypothetical protein
MPRDTLTDRERKRLDRFEKMQQNRRGRSSPAVMPSKLARTAAFAPRKKNLVTDSNFKRVYESLFADGACRPVLTGMLL